MRYWVRTWTAQAAASESCPQAEGAESRLSDNNRAGSSARTALLVKACSEAAICSVARCDIMATVDKRLSPDKMGCVGHNILAFRAGGNGWTAACRRG